MRDSESSSHPPTDNPTVLFFHPTTTATYCRASPLPTTTAEHRAFKRPWTDCEGCNGGGEVYRITTIIIDKMMHLKEWEVVIEFPESRNWLPSIDGRKYLVVLNDGSVSMALSPLFPSLFISPSPSMLHGRFKTLLPCL
ncbi:ATPase [Sesbania bispinosa]|nr:ATPase [Sesbania bispinosa]